mgnify:CR=1 FL=1
MFLSGDYYVPVSDTNFFWRTFLFFRLDRKKELSKLPEHPQDFGGQF